MMSFSETTLSLPRQFSYAVRVTLVKIKTKIPSILENIGSMARRLQVHKKMLKG